MLINSDDLEKSVDFLFQSFALWYVQNGFNFEIGLTGSKMEAVAAAALSAFCKVTQCWYVRPKEFDPQRFTSGAGETRFFEISAHTGYGKESKPGEKKTEKKTPLGRRRTVR